MFKKFKFPNFKIPKLSYKGYVRYLRKQSIHIQQLHAVVFASIITGMTAFLILYYDYGFFHDVYVQKDDTITSDLVEQAPSPTDTFSGFISEAKTRFGAIGVSGADLLYGKDVYINNSTSTQ